MVNESYQRYLSRLLLNFSDLADTDEEIALCLTYMHVAPPANETQWTAALVRSLIPEAFSCVSSASPYASNQTTHAADAYCIAVLNYIKKKGVHHAS
jgi:hypothetical protein